MKEFSDELLAFTRLFGAFERESVCCGGVTVPQCLALQVLLDGPHDISSLTAHAAASQSATTRLVDGLERRGWVVREPAGDDRRRVVVRLTPDGRGEARRLRDLTERTVRAVLSGVPRAKRRQVTESMRLLRQALAAVRAGGEACCG